MNEKFPGLMIAYEGGNIAHRTYRASLANAKALTFILQQDNSAVLTRFLAHVKEEKWRSKTGDFAIGMVCGSATTTSFRAMVLTGTEIRLIETELGGFVSQALGLVYREVHRVFETYLIDLFGDIASADERVLISQKTISHEEALRATNRAELQRIIVEKRKSELTRVGFTELEKIFEKLGLPIVPLIEARSPEELTDVRRRLVRLSAMRNVIEHKHSVVDADFLKLVPESGYKVGNCVSIDLSELQHAISAVEWTVDGLNQRAAEKFGICA